MSTRRRRRDPGARAAQRSALRARARRTRRRDTPRGYHYEPLRVDAKAAERGVHVRLLGAIVAGAVTFASAFAVLAMSPDKFTFLALTALAVSGLLVTVSLILSARREELVHQLANDLQGEPAGLLPHHADSSEEGRLQLEVLAGDGRDASSPQPHVREDAHARDGSL